MNDDERIEKLQQECEGLSLDEVRWVLSKMKVLESKLQIAKEALEGLCSEGIAMLKVHEDAIRADYGNSNFESLKAQWEKARQALEQIEKLEIT